MGERAFTVAPEEATDVTRRDGESYAESPAIRLLDALRSGDDLGVLAVCGDTTTVTAENMRWSCQGRDEIHRMLTAARERFPGLAFESRTRHIGFGLVIDEARVQDLPAEEPGAERTEVGTGPEASIGPSGEAAADVGSEGPGKHAGRSLTPAPADAHPMWDEPVTEKRNVMAVWQERYFDELPAARLNMPVRVTVRHDDLQVHDITLSFPAALLKRALGLHVDPLEMSLSEVQSAFIAPVGAGFTTHTLARPELALVPPAPAEPEPDVATPEPPRRRRRGRVLVPVLLALIAVAAGGAWWTVQGESLPGTAAPPVPSGPSAASTPTQAPSASATPSARPSSTKAPTVTHAPPSNAPSRKPNVTLKSDLAFGFNSATLSKAAKTAIDRVARQVRDAGLTGKIYVDGYTDNLGSAAYGLVLSQRRADAVSHYLGSQLIGVPVTIVSIGHGEADPVAPNATRQGRIANRRVTITLPKP